MKIYFVRHGQTNYNLMHLCNDDPRVNVHLTELGKQQAREVAERLKSTPLELVITSELPRTKETADIINIYHNTPIISDGRINDRKTGFEGRPTRDFNEAVQRSGNIFYVKFHDGETFQEEKQRVSSFLDYIRTVKHNSLLVVSHNEILKIVNGLFLNLSDEQMWNTPIAHCQVLKYQV